MTYFDCFVIGAWAFAFGWSVGAIYMQNHANKPAEKPERAALVEVPRELVSCSAGCSLSDFPQVAYSQEDATS